MKLLLKCTAAQFQNTVRDKNKIFQEINKAIFFSLTSEQNCLRLIALLHEKNQIIELYQSNHVRPTPLERKMLKNRF